MAASIGTCAALHLQDFIQQREVLILVSKIFFCHLWIRDIYYIIMYDNVILYKCIYIMESIDMSVFDLWNFNGTKFSALRIFLNFRFQFTFCSESVRANSPPSAASLSASHRSWWSPAWISSSSSRAEQAAGATLRATHRAGDLRDSSHRPETLQSLLVRRCASPHHTAPPSPPQHKRSAAE